MSGARDAVIAALVKAEWLIAGAPTNNFSSVEHAGDHIRAALTALRAEDAAERDAVERLIEVAEAYDGESFDAFCAIEAARALWPAKGGT